MSTYTGLSGKSYRLDGKPFNSGGEGDIYNILSENGLVAKIYHPGIASKELEDKLTFMVRKSPDSSVLSQVAWPADVIYNSNNSFGGFVMPKLKITTELLELYKYPPGKYKNVTSSQKIMVAQNICVVISAVHKAGYVFGDFNPRNIGIDINTGRVAFLDTDSYHVVLDKKRNRAYRCKVCLDGYVAPELLFKIERENIKEKAFAQATLDTFTQETDNFALAVHIFKLLMNGYTPFNGIKETDTASQASPGLGNVAVKRNNYCFKPGSKPQAPAVPPIDVLPKQIADFFTRAFLDGSRDPKARPTALEWYNALGQYENLLVKCNKNSAHEYYNALNSCPWCEADDRFRKACAPSMTQRKFAQPPVVVQPPPSQQRTYGTASATARQTQLPGGTTGTTPHPANLPYGGGVGGMGGVGGTGAGGGMSGVGGTGGPGTGAPGGTGGTGGGSTKRTPDAPDIGWKIVPLILGSALLYNILYKSLINQDPETTVVFAITSVIAIVLMSLVKFEYVERLALGSITFPVVAIAYDVIFSELSSSFWDWFATIVLGPFVFALLLALPCYFIMWIQDLNKSP